ncbi:MAG: hypothetical protein AMXMBFR64_05120 [Myxococcales bacterium]
MPANARALALTRHDWTGTATLSDGTNTAGVAPITPASAFQAWKTLLDAAAAHWTITWSVSADSTLSYTSTTALTLVFTGGLHTLLGFATDTFSASTTRTGTGVPLGVVPGPLRWTGLDRLPEDQGTPGHARASWLRVPALTLRQPEASCHLTTAQAESAVRSWGALSAPGTIHVYTDGPALATLYPTRFELRRAGIGMHKLQVTGVLP